MANDCLVTRLKGVVNNSDLPKLGCAVFDISESNSLASFIYVTNNVSGQCILTGDGYFTDQTGTENYGQAVDVTAETRLYIKGSGKLEIPNKYNITYFYCISPNVSGKISDFFYNSGTYLTIGSLETHSNIAGDITDGVLHWNSLQFTNCENITGSLTKTIQEYGTNIEGLELYNTSLPFEMEWLENTPNITRSFHVSKASGDFSYLGYTKVPSAYLSPNAASNVTGSIEDFVAKRIASGQSTGTFNIQWPQTYTKVTYNSKTLKENCDLGIISVSGDTIFTWDAQGNITWSTKA